MQDSKSRGSAFSYAHPPVSSLDLPIRNWERSLVPYYCGIPSFFSFGAITA